MAIKDFMLLKIIIRYKHPWTFCTCIQRFQAQRKHDTNIAKDMTQPWKKRCQRSYTFLYHYAPTSSWVLARVGANNVHSEESQHLQNGYCCGVVSRGFNMVDASTCHNFNFDYYGSLSQGPFLGDQVLVDTSKVAKDHGATRLERPKILHLCGEHPWDIQISQRRIV